MDTNSAEDRGLVTRRKRILLVEENFLIRWDSSQYLRETGFEVLEAVSAQEAMTVLLAGSTIDAVFCDINLGSDVDGLEFSAWLADRYPNLPVLLTSGDPNSASRSKKTPRRDFVDKPYVMGDIERRLVELIGAT